MTTHEERAQDSKFDIRSLRRQHLTLERLGQNARSGQLKQAYLFYGQDEAFIPEATQAFVSLVFCKNPVDTYACRQCKPCLDIQNNTFPDLYTVGSDKGSISIEEVKALQEYVQYGPITYPYLIAIIPAAERLTTSAANAFLKTLEEPEKGVVFILQSSAYPSILPTIKSRCQGLYFPSLSDEALHALDPESSHPFLAAMIRYRKDEEQVLYIPLESMLNQNLFERLASAEKLSQDKKHLRFHCYAWLWECKQNIKKNPDQADLFLRLSQQMIQTLETLQFNVNVRLQTEALLLGIKSV